MSPDASSPERREFLKRLGLAGAGLMFAGNAAAAPTPPPADSSTTPDRVPRRKFGRHDFTVSALCLGGHTLRVASDDEAAKIVDACLERGLDFFDNAWDYHDGRAEELMGKLLAGRRDKVFLMTKVCSNHVGGGKARAMAMLEESLRRLRTDHLDLWQLHELASMKQVESAYAKDGTLEALTEAKQQGKVRFIGFTGHSAPDVHLAMLSHGFPFDACQLPINAIDRLNATGFRETVIPELVRQGIAPIGMKSMGGHGSGTITSGRLTPEQALRFVLSTPVTTVVTGVKSAAEIGQNIKIASAFVPLTNGELSELESRFPEESGRYVHYTHPAYRDGHGIA